MSEKQSIEQMMVLSKALASSELLPAIMQKKEANVLFAIMAGAELGLSPMASIRGIHVIKGKPTLAADTMVAVVMRSGLCEYFRLVEETETQCTYETKRTNNADPSRYTYTAADQETAGLVADSHLTHPKAMRRARCKSILARDVYPDALAGVYASEEMVDDAQIVSPLEIAAAAASIDLGTILEKLAAAKSIGELKIQGAQIAALALPAESKATVRAVYEAKIAELKAAPIDVEPAVVP